MSEPKLGLIGVGPQRAGTTWIYLHLREHPRLCFPSGVKETFFLDQRWERGWEWYWSHFRCVAHQIRAEIAPTLFDIPEAVERLHEHNPQCRIVVSLRDPAERSYSLYLLLLKFGYVTGTFEEAMESNSRIIDSSRYARHLPRWIDAFGEERVLVVLQEEIAELPWVTLERVCEHAGVDAALLGDLLDERVNPSTLPKSHRLAALGTRVADWLRDRSLYGPIEAAKRAGLKSLFYRGGGTPPPLTIRTRLSLVRTFEEDIAFVESLLGRPLGTWRND